MYLSKLYNHPVVTDGYTKKRSKYSISSIPSSFFGSTYSITKEKNDTNTNLEILILQTSQAVGFQHRGYDMKTFCKKLYASGKITTQEYRACLRKIKHRLQI